MTPTRRSLLSRSAVRESSRVSISGGQLTYLQHSAVHEVDRQQFTCYVEPLGSRQWFSYANWRGLSMLRGAYRPNAAEHRDAVACATFPFLLFLFLAAPTAA